MTSRILTHDEDLFEKIDHERLTELLAREGTRIHSADVSSNNYGEYLFITATFTDPDGKKECYTFFGLGYHEQRERWMTKTWSFYRNWNKPRKGHISLNSAKRMLDERIADIAGQGAYAPQPKRSDRGVLFAFLADLTDDDAAACEIEDMGLFEE